MELKWPPIICFIDILGHFSPTIAMAYLISFALLYASGFYIHFVGASWFIHGPVLIAILSCTLGFFLGGNELTGMGFMSFVSAAVLFFIVYFYFLFLNYSLLPARLLIVQSLYFVVLTVVFVLILNFLGYKALAHLGYRDAGMR